jgi:putative IMPACT (imprinted ancient) family translation regulator
MLFRAAGIWNVCCVVTRYFGGTLLGAGGLVRAYSAAAGWPWKAAGDRRLLSLVSGPAPL